MRFVLTGAEEQLPEGDKEYLFQVKEKMHEDLGLCPALFSKTLFGDVDLYVRFGSRYGTIPLCLDELMQAVKLGVYVPSATSA